MNKKRKNIINSNKVSMVKEFNLNGYPQKVLIEGKSEDLPILITLHAGPGTPIPFCVGSRGLFPEITDKCILVCWDQYGCGINNAILPDTLTINDYVDMTIDLIKEMKNLYPSNPIWLFAMSWGSILSAKVAVKVPELIDGVISYGQVLNRLMTSDEAIDTLMNSKAPEKTKKVLKDFLDSKTFNKDMVMKLSNTMKKYTYGYNNPNEPSINIGSMIWGLLTSPDYKFKDFKAMMVNGYLKNNSLFEELFKIDISKELSAVTLPYHIIQGDTDIVTSTTDIKNFVEKSDNSNLTCQVIKDSAHLPGANGMDAVFEKINNL